MSQLTTHPVSKIKGDFFPPGDKSISHRVVMLGALGEGESEFSNFLDAEDCLRTVQAFESMGTKVNWKRRSDDSGRETKTLIIEGVGLGGLKAPKLDLDLGNSGTTMRLLLGVLAGQPFQARLTGDDSLSKRPMKRVTGPLQRMGAKISGSDDANFAPLTIQGGKLKGINWRNEIGSAQVKSALLLASLYATGLTTIHEPRPTRDHTERLLTLFGAPVDVSEWKIAARKPERLGAVKMAVPGDFSSAAFIVAAALITPDSDIEIRNVGLNPTRIGFYKVLRSMGANLEIECIEDKGEPVGTLHVKGSKLNGIILNQESIPNIIDELPILMILCALAEGESVISGAEELRVKETDRILSMAEGLRTIGGRIKETPDGCVIEGVPEFKGGRVSSFQDHRTAMSFAIAGLRAQKGVVVDDTDCIAISYPHFESDIKRFLAT